MVHDLLRCNCHFNNEFQFCTGDTSEELAMNGVMTPVKLSPFAQRSNSSPLVGTPTKFSLDLDLSNSKSSSITPG